MTLLRDDLEAPADQRQWGSGWISGSWALVLSVISLGIVICLRYPDLLSMTEARQVYRSLPIRFVLFLLMIAAFSLASISLALRKNKVLGTTALSLVLLAS